jgi:signal transduction histidine kinase
LHDGAQQRLLAAIIRLRLLQAEPDPAARDAEVVACTDELEETLRELRELARGVHPAIVTELGLVGAVDDLAARSVVPVKVVADVTHRLPADQEVNLYFAITEALTNATRHARAEQVWIELREERDEFVVTVRDDGVGGADPTGSGIFGLSDRLAAQGGRVDIDSPPGVGTTLTMVTPLVGVR